MVSRAARLRGLQLSLQFAVDQIVDLIHQVLELLGQNAHLVARLQDLRGQGDAVIPGGRAANGLCQRLQMPEDALGDKLEKGRAEQDQQRQQIQLGPYGVAQQAGQAGMIDVADQREPPVQEAGGGHEITRPVQRDDFPWRADIRPHAFRRALRAAIEAFSVQIGFQAVGKRGIGGLGLMQHLLQMDQDHFVAEHVQAQVFRFADRAAQHQIGLILPVQQKPFCVARIVRLFDQTLNGFLQLGVLRDAAEAVNGAVAVRYDHAADIAVAGNFGHGSDHGVMQRRLGLRKLRAVGGLDFAQLLLHGFVRDDPQRGAAGVRHAFINVMVIAFHQLVLIPGKLRVIYRLDSERKPARATTRKRTMQKNMAYRISLRMDLMVCVRSSALIVTVPLRSS